VFRHQRQEGSCDNLRVRRGGGDSGSGAFVAGDIFLEFIQMRNITRVHLHVIARCGAVLMIGEAGLHGVTQRERRFTAALDRCFVDPDGEIVQRTFKRGCGKTWPSQRSEERGLQSGVRTFLSPGWGWLLFPFHPRLTAWAAFSPFRGYKPLPPAIEGTSKTSSPS
jgi:hypothetical protein